LQLEGNNPDVLRNAFYLYRSEGRFDRALQTILAATERDPLFFLNSAMLGQAHFLVREYAQALTSCRRAFDLYPGATFVHYEAAFVQLALGQPGAALAENALESDAMYRANGLPQVLDALGRTHEADRARADFIRKFGGPHPHYAALMFAAHGDLDQAFAWWDRALQQHDTDLPRLKMAPAYALMPQLAADPRFKALLRKMNLPEA
jgi:tetratricopeptide (TPR) repeat protein